MNWAGSFSSLRRVQPVEAALKLMKLDEFFTIQASLAGARMVMESMAGTVPVTSGVTEAELQIRWTGEVTALNAMELGVYTESELSQVTPGMTVAIDLSRVTFVDSTGIGLMVRFKRNLKRRDINLISGGLGPQRGAADPTGGIPDELALTARGWIEHCVLPGNPLSR